MKLKLLILCCAATSLFTASFAWADTAAPATSTTATTAMHPANVAKKWAEAVKNRDGKVQYSLMCTNMQKAHLKELQDSNWATGLSSPWVSKYSVSPVSQNKNTAVFKIDYVTATGAGVFEPDVVDHLKIISTSPQKWCIQNFKLLSP